MISDNDYQNWLSSGGLRVALVEVDTDTPRLLSTVPYTTLPTDTPANKVYLPCVAGGFAFSEQLSLDGTPSISVGDIEIHNEEGELDDWLLDVWTNRAVRVYIGDASWSRSDFRLEFSGVVESLTSSSSDRLNIVIGNKLDRLNTPVSEAVLGGETPNKDRLLPIVFGECHNTEPLLTNPSTLEYMVHNGPMERVIEVRDNGVPITAYTEDLLTGKITLAKSPAGAITVSVQGRVPYENTVANIIKVLATEYGNSSERFSEDDIDLVSLNSFNTAHPQPVGVNLPDRANVLQVCQELASSVGAQVIMSRQGKLKLAKITLPGIGTPVPIYMHDYEAKSLAISSRTSVISGVKLGFCKNWTVQSNLDTGLPAESKDLFAQEWLTTNVKDGVVASTYRLHAEPPQVDTLLLKGTDAQVEAQRRLDLWKVQRTVYRVEGYANLLTLELGQAVTLYGDRFGLNDGKSGVVIGLQRDWVAGRCNVEVLV